MEQAGLTETCESLDETLLELMASLKELSNLRNSYTDVVKEGYLGLSLARHAMGGPSHVSSLQYDSGMKTLVQVETKTTDSEGNTVDSAILEEALLPETAHKDMSLQLSLERFKPGAPCMGKGGREEEKTVLRQRKGEELVSIEDVPREGVKEEKEVPPLPLKDPLRWFGVLVPRDLRRAQQNFMQVIEYSVELAEAQTRFQLAEKKYQQLLLSKKLREN